MALPASGNSISLSQINTELGRSATAQVSLNTAEDNGYVAINGCSLYRPRAANPAKFSEWFSYNHAATCNYCYNGSNAITGSFSLTPGNYVNLAFPISFQGAVGESTITLTTSNVTGGTINAQAYFSQYSTTYNSYIYLNSPEAGLYAPGITNATASSASVGSRAADYGGTDGLDYISLYINFDTGGTRTGDYALTFSCPSIPSCGNTLTSVVGNCQYTDWHWLDAGTTSRNITLTYSIGSGFNNANPRLYIKDENNNTIVNGVYVTGGSNQTYTFYFTYTGYRYIKILFYDEYAC